MTSDFKFKALPPSEAIRHFRSKGYKYGYSWKDVWLEEHAHAFTVAKAMRSDVLQDLRQGIDSAMANGVPFEEFKKNIRPTLQEKGWWCKKLMTDPVTGEQQLVQLGSPRRLRTIYDTNLRSAYAAGKWERIQRSKKHRPYLRYVSVLDGRERQQHGAWHDIVLPVDHPFWAQFYPPNGWGCRCSVQQLSPRDLKRRGLSVTSNADLPKEKKDYINNRTGEVTKVPQGISPSFAYNVGQARMRALVPPQQSRALAVPFAGNPNAVPPPTPRKIPADRLYSDGMSNQEYVDKFLNEFKISPGQTGVFKDVAGEHVIISDALFKTATGRFKLHRDMRHRHLGLLADTIKDPDEIWINWEEYPKGRHTLRRKYLRWVEVDGKKTGGFILFDTGKDGWDGVTAFKPQKQSYIDKQRSGTLVYKKGKK